MPTILTHGLMAAAGYRLADGGRDRSVLGPAVAAVVAAAPDADVLWWNLTTYGAPWGHRGMTHSLVFAAVLGVGVAAVLHRRVTFPGGFKGLAVLLTVVAASHGLFDALTDGGYGIAFFAPFDDTRYFLPWRPVPVAPIGPRLDSPRLWQVIAAEAFLFWPAAFAMWRARCGGVRHRWWQVAAAVGIVVVAWGARLG